MGQNVNVLHLDTGQEWRGGQGQVLLLMRGLRSRGHASVLLARGELLERARADGFRALEWRPRGDGDPRGLMAVLSALGRWRSDLIHGHTAHAHAHAALGGLVVRRPVVVSRRVGFPVGRHLFSWIKYRLPIDRYVCVSHHVRDVMVRSGIDAERLSVVPSGLELPDPCLGGAGVVDPDHPGSELRRIIGAPPRAPVVGIVASLSAEKNHRVLLGAASRVIQFVPHVHFVLVGEGERRQAIERERARLGLEPRVHLLGFREDVRELIAQFTIFVLPSSHEGMGTSLLEAQALGVPIVASRVGGIPEVVTDGVTGRLVEAGDAEGLATALIETLQQPERSAEWAARGRESVRALSADRMVERTIDVYQSLIDARRPRRERRVEAIR